jgi:hypothetical protein
MTHAESDYIGPLCSGAGRAGRKLKTQAANGGELVTCPVCKRHIRTFIANKLPKHHAPRT